MTTRRHYHHCHIQLSEQTEIELIMLDLWDDKTNYFFTIDGVNQSLTRRNCGFTNCRRQTQLEFCRRHLKEKLGLEVKESQIPGSGWGLYTTEDRAKGEFISNFTGVEREFARFRGLSEFVAWRGVGFIIDSSIERCSAACANSATNTLFRNNCSIITYGGCYIKTSKAVRKGDELFVAYGRTYRWK